MDVIACCAYGIEIDSVRTPDHPIVVNAKKILNVDASFSTFLSFMFPVIAKAIGCEPFNKKAMKFFDDLTFQIVERRIKQTDAKQNSDFMGLMIEESNNIPGTI
ncbi:Cytochrome P450 3A4 [Blomia tropicalis]|nr:Cytochrome P450 3A4 [Blomia tropicalis]